ncbi:conserved hypothetical protein [Ricinus communis]|uniref:Uncharacterized protein n=1 Tax=Ricinus communis TaxID=3988 RepID=B9RV12_RICCO|nr:conserved hypothetical protein [Ricinus communis]
MQNKSESGSKSAKDAIAKQWEKALCPICIGHPHNTVLLHCSSSSKGLCAKQTTASRIALSSFSSRQSHLHHKELLFGCPARKSMNSKLL